MKKIITTAFSICAFIGFFGVSFAQLSLDRTRVVLDLGKANSVSVVVGNSNKNVPYLAQSWIEDDKGQKITAPLIALPILQRLDGGQEKQIKVSLTNAGAAALLPSDRESMFFFNVLGVPPKSGGSGNDLNIVLQSKLKLFYRPKGLLQYEGTDGWVKEMIVKKTFDGLLLENPTPYHIILYGFTFGNSRLIEKDVILKPFSTEKVFIKGNDRLAISYITDQGASKDINYICQGEVCNEVSR